MSRYMPLPLARGHHASASAAPTPTALSIADEFSDQDYQALVPLNPNPPTLTQLAQLTHVPMSMLQNSYGGARGRRGKAKKKRTSAKFYNVAAGRPFPRVTSLEQTIVVTVTTIFPAILTSSTTNPVYYSHAFTLQDFGGTSSYITVFDQYRFDKIECWLEPTTGTSNGGYPMLATCVDLDDANTPTQFSQLEDHQQALVGEGQAGRYHAWKPHLAVAAYSGAFTSYSNAPATWIDSSSVAVQHYGFKAATYTASSGSVSYTLTARATVSFRAPGIN